MNTNGTQYVIASRLVLRSPRHLLRFLRGASRVDRQVKAAPGRIDSRLRSQFRSLTFWTLSSWDDAASMRAFVVAEPHRSVMHDLSRRQALATGEFRSWEAPGGSPLPPWEEVAARFAESLSPAADRRSGRSS